MPSIFSRKPWTKCWRACSPSVTISTPASSCSLTATSVASRLARARTSPEDFQGAHSVLGSASHSGFGKEPAIVVGNSMRASRSVLIEAPVCHVRHALHKTASATGTGVFRRLGWRQSLSGSSHDRPSLRADTERLENLDHAGGIGASLYGRSRQHPGWRAIQAGISGDQPEQSYSGDRRPAACRRRRAVFGIRDRRHPDLSRRKGRPFPACGYARPLQGGAMGDVANGRVRAHARPARPFRALRAGENPLCDRTLPRRGGAALSRARYPAGQDRGVRRRRLFDCRYRLLSMDHDPQGAGFYARRLSQCKTLVCGCPRAAAGAGWACDRQIRQGAVRRGGAQEYVRAGGEGDGGTKIAVRHSGAREARARNPYSPSWLWIPGLRQVAHPGVTSWIDPPDYKQTNNKGKRRHDRVLLRLLQSLDLSRLPQHPAAGKRIRRPDFVAADPD